MHGNADESVPLVQGELMFEALQEVGVVSEFIEFDGTNHSPTLQQAERGRIAALRWFEQYLQSKRSKTEDK
jgi:dipeptidyl aminopeptidase/acylaminoacyl peptidase